MPDAPPAKAKRRIPDLRAVAPETVEEHKAKVLLYGAPGTGKSWISLDFPAPYYIDTEDGANFRHYREKLMRSGGAYMGTAEGSLDFDTVIDQVVALVARKHPFKTFVLDSVSKLWMIALSDEQESLGSKDVFGAFKKAPTRKYINLMKWIGRLDMTVILIAHQRELWGLDDKGQRAMIGYTYDGQDKLEHDLHMSLRVFKNGISHYAQVNKTRLRGFQESEIFPWSYDEFARRYGHDVMERSAVPVDLATPEQIKEMQALLEIVRMPEDWEARIFKAARVEEWADMDRDRIGKCIAMVRERAKAADGATPE